MIIITLFIYQYPLEYYYRSYLQKGKRKMKIMASDDDFLKLRENNLMLSDNDIKILQDNGIDYLKYKSLSELIFIINQELLVKENDKLENLCMKLEEYNYYNYINK